MAKVATMTVAGEPRVQWTSYDRQKADEWNSIWKAVKEATAEYRGLAAAVPAPAATLSRLLNVIPIGDPHVGMLAWAQETGHDFDSKIAQVDLSNVVSMLVDRAPPATNALIAQLGDFFHAEDDTARTPRGNNALDVDTRAGRITKLGCLLMRQVIELALAKHEHVTVINLRGNHDPYKSIALNMYLDGVYEKEPRVTILDNNNPFIFHEHGLNLLGFHPRRRRQARAASWHHGLVAGRSPVGPRSAPTVVHRPRSLVQRQGLPGCTWESFRTLAPGDFWAHWKGYRSEQSLDCLTFDIEHGLQSVRPYRSGSRARRQNNMCQDLDRLIRTIEEDAAHGKDAAKELEPFYEKKVRPDKDAIKNLEALQANRPLKPPGRS
jgi:hypothetical protein